MILALFDFDGTITKKDSLIQFIIFANGYSKFVFGMFLLSPVLLAYKMKWIKNYRAKEFVLSFFFKDWDVDKFLDKATAFADTRLNDYVYRDALQRIKWHQGQGHQVVVVSASIDWWLAPWCQENNLGLIASKLRTANGKITGQLSGRNCYGPEKVNRIREEINLARYSRIYAYGDSSGDKEMLSLADKQFYKYFKQ